MTVAVECNGHSFCGCYYDFQKNYMAAHEGRLSRGERVRQIDHIELDGSELFRPKAENNLEGVVANEIDIA